MGNSSFMPGNIFFPPQEKVVFGKGMARELSAELDRLGKKRAFVITGTTIAEKTDLLNQIKKIIGPRLAGVYYPISQHVAQEDVIAAALEAKKDKADILVSLGGSSPVDGAKGVALCLSEEVFSEEQLIQYDVHSAEKAIGQSEAVPHIAITTTLSAGEFGSSFGITDKKRGIKKIYANPKFIPKVVILDPQFSAATPDWLWSSTGMRAVDHAVERIYSIKHQPMVDALCLQALRYLFANLVRSIHEPHNMELRLNCQLGAYMSAFGLISVGTGVGHAIGHQLGGRCNVPHGQTSCIMLPHAMNFNLRKCPAAWPWWPRRWESMPAGYRSGRRPRAPWWP